MARGGSHVRQHQRAASSRRALGYVLLLLAAALLLWADPSGMTFGTKGRHASRRELSRSNASAREAFEKLEGEAKDSGGAAAEAALPGNGEDSLKVDGQADPTVQSVFETIYQLALWTDAGGGSGGGSTLNATMKTRAILSKLIKNHDVNSLADVPCGAMAWMPYLLEDMEAQRPGFRYLGMDVARPVIERNKANFSDHPNWSFAVVDMSTQMPPLKGYDMVLTRDALQHLPCHRVVASIKNLAFSGVKHLIFGSYNRDAREPVVNPDLGEANAAGYFSIDLREKPFSLVPDEAHDEETNHPLEPNKLMLVFSASELQKQDFAAMGERCKLQPPRVASIAKSAHGDT